MASGHPPRASGTKGPKQTQEIPTEWRIELPESGANADSEFGGCRSIEAGYDRGPVLGQGTYGEVYLATDLAKGDQVAAKKIKMDNEKEGFPITAIREIKILSALAGAQEKMESVEKGGEPTFLRNNIIGLREIVRSGSHRVNNFKGSIYMVFDYMDHDMTGLLERSRKEGPQFTAPQIKCYLKQLFCGLWLLDQRSVLHRDLKNANLLVNNKGELKIADFGLARYYNKPDDRNEGTEQVDSRMTNRVITLWYRPPELFLGAERYGTEIDTWSAGCIMFELLTGKPLFPGTNETDQVERIFSIMGQPNEQTMPGCTAYANYERLSVSRFPLRSRLRQHCDSRGVKDPRALDLLEQLLALNPAARIKAEHAVTHQYFFSDPMPCKPSQMPTFPSSHEMTMKKARHEQRYGGQQRAQQHGQPRPPPPPPQQGGPPSQRQRTQGQYTGPQQPYPQQQQPYRSGGAGQQPYRGGGAGGAPAAGAMGGGIRVSGGGIGGSGAPVGIMPDALLTQQQVQQMMGQGIMAAPMGMVQPPGMVQPQQGAGGYGYGSQAGRPGGIGGASGGAQTHTGVQPHRYGGGAQPSWSEQKR